MKKLNIHTKKNNLFIRYKRDLDFPTKNNFSKQSQFAIEKPAPRINYFIKNLQSTIEKNMEYENFSIVGLCKIIGISRSQLHNKIKAATGISTSHFINNIRLKKAQQLLTTTDFNVSEVAYEVGFNSPSYFSVSFLKKYGQRPSDLQKLFTST